MYQFFKTALQRHIVFNAMRISLVVGTALNMINQGTALLESADIPWGHLLINYLVPYSVATYSATVNELGRRDPIRSMGAE